MNLNTTRRTALFVATVPITLEAFLIPYADHFRSEGWRVDALANGASSCEPIAEHFDARFDVAWSRNPFAPSNLQGTVRRVRDIVRAGRYDIVHVHTPVAAWVTRYALRRGTRPKSGPIVVYTAHGFHFYRGQRALPHTFFRTMERVAAPWTDVLVTINAEDYQAASRFVNPPTKLLLIPGIGVDTERYAPGGVTIAEASRVREELRISEDDFLLTMIAELVPTKRHRFALEALAEAHAENVVLALVGDGPADEQIRADVDRLGLRDRVRFAGYRKDIPVVLAASDALLMCSEREGLNRSVLEAMASGRPAIGTDTRGIADAIGSEESGWIVPKDDSRALAKAIREAASNPDEVKRRGTAARKRACAEFSLQRVIDAYDGLYHEALASRV